MLGVPAPLGGRASLGAVTVRAARRATASAYDAAMRVTLESVAVLSAVLGVVIGLIAMIKEAVSTHRREERRRRELDSMFAGVIEPRRPTSAGRAAGGTATRQPSPLPPVTDWPAKEPAPAPDEVDLADIADQLVTMEERLKSDGRRQRRHSLLYLIAGALLGIPIGIVTTFITSRMGL